MSRIYLNQSNLRVWVSTGADLTGYTTASILVRNPSSTTTTWTATVDNASTGSIYYDIPTTTILSVAGTWLIQAKIIYSDDSTSLGRTTSFKVFNLYE